MYCLDYKIQIPFYGARKKQVNKIVDELFATLSEYIGKVVNLRISNYTSTFTIGNVSIKNEYFENDLFEFKVVNKLVGLNESNHLLFFKAYSETPDILEKLKSIKFSSIDEGFFFYLYDIDLSLILLRPYDGSYYPNEVKWESTMNKYYISIYTDLLANDIHNIWNVLNLNRSKFKIYDKYNIAYLYFEDVRIDDKGHLVVIGSYISCTAIDFFDFIYKMIIIEAVDQNIQIPTFCTDVEINYLMPKLKTIAEYDKEKEKENMIGLEPVINSIKVEGTTTIINLEGDPFDIKRIDKLLIDNMFEDVKSVHFNDPYTIITWKDGSSTKVSSANEKYDPEYGVVFCLLKKLLGNTSNYYDLVKKVVKKGNEQATIREEIKKKRAEKKKNAKMEAIMKEAKEEDEIAAFSSEL